MLNLTMALSVLYKVFRIYIDGMNYKQVQRSDFINVQFHTSVFILQGVCDLEDLSTTKTSVNGHFLLITYQGIDAL